MVQPNRLPADAAHGFGGAALDRNRPLTFRLDGRSIEAFAGDTVLTALLATGIFSAGTHGGTPIGLDERAAPLVAQRGDLNTVFPIDRLPALNGLDLVTLGPQGESLTPRSLLDRLLHKVAARTETLGLRLDDLPPVPWLDREPDERLEAEILVIGGGVAGLSAANATRGKTILVERRLWLGGDARYFGTTGDEDPPDVIIARLVGALEAETLLGTEVFALSGNTALAHQVRVTDGRLSTRILAIAAKRIVLATGAFERLPVFAGNRLPGVVGAIAAFHRAERFGVWLGRRALLSTPGSHGYRLALLAKDAGLDVQRIADTRLAPHSRFIDFCKASGVSFATGLIPQSAAPSGKGKTGLAVGFAVAIDDIRQETGLTETDQFVATGSLQPELSLWLQASGRAAWADGRIEAIGELPGIVLAGAAAGYRGTMACLASGRAAAAGRNEPLDDPAIDVAFETPDGPTPVGPPVDGRAAYLDRGADFVPRPADPDDFVWPRGLSLGAVAAAVEIGAIPIAMAGQVVAERSVVGADILDTGWRVLASPAAGEPPAYLHGRFGARPQPCVVTSADARYFERGCLVFASSAVTDPMQSVGCIVGPAPDRGVGGLALIEREASQGAKQLFVRDAGGAVPVERIERVKI